MPLVYFAVIVFGAIFAAGGVLWLLMRAFGARDADRARRALIAEGAVAGKIVVEGEALPFGDRLAACTRWGSLRRLWPKNTSAGVSHRAEVLWLDTADGRVRVDGPVTVVAGSTQRWEGADYHHDRGKLFDVVASVADGDEVLVRDGRIAARRAPRTSVRAKSLWLHPLVIASALLAMVPAYAVAKSYDETAEACASACRASGECHVTAASPNGDLDFFTCTAETSDDCQRSEACLEWGRCSAVDGECRAAKDEDCAHTPSCLTSGWCSAVDGKCRATKDEDCASLKFCEELGQCSAVNGDCRAVEPEDCKQSPHCRSSGRCTVMNGICVVGSDADCKATPRCAERGACSAVGANCVVAKDEDCRATEACRERGLCSAVNGTCIADDDAYCQASRNCARKRECRAVGGVCVAQGASCRDSDACKVYGRCHGDDTCEAGSDGDCKKSLNCTQHGACNKLGYDCAASCAESSLCRDLGLCAQQGKECLPSEAGCAKSTYCKRYGACSLTGDRCSAASDADCASTPACRQSGACSARSGECVVGKDADCVHTDMCRDHGHCTARKGKCVAGTAKDCHASRACRSSRMCRLGSYDCMLGEDDAHCRSLRTCNTLGLCSAHADACVAARAEDCQASAVCALYGWCTASDGRCFL